MSMDSKLYKKVDKVSHSLNESNDCSIKALAIVTQQPYGIVHTMLSRLGRKSRRGTLTAEAIATIHNLGFKVVKVRSPQYVNKHSKTGHSQYTTKTLHKCVGVQTGRWFGMTSTHSFAFVNGKVHDWSDDRKFRVVVMWKIVPDTPSN